jgi:hypothetical protein
MKVKIPIIKEPIGSGELIKQVTSAIGIKPCGGCQKRAEKLNRAIQFVPLSFEAQVKDIQKAIIKIDETLQRVHKVNNIITVDTVDKQGNKWKYQWVDNELKDRINA